MGKNFDGQSLRQPVFAIQLENIERENFNRLLAKRQIRQYFPVKTLLYTVFVGTECRIENQIQESRKHWQVW